MVQVTHLVPNFDGATTSESFRRSPSAMPVPSRERQVSLPLLPILKSLPPLPRDCISLYDMPFALEFEHHVKFVGHAHRAP